MFDNYIRKKISKMFTGESDIALQSRTPSHEKLNKKFQNIDEMGIYLHIPFCERICPYCPYNKEVYCPDMAKKYTAAVKKEIDFYSEIVGDKPVSSFYIGGGTPTTMLHNGIEEMLVHIFNTFNMQCEIHMESHPNHLSEDNLNTIKSMGVTNLSIGVESLQDKHLQTLRRPYTTEDAMATVDRVVNMDFKCINLDFMFALPNQTYDEIEEAGQTLVEMGVNQVAAYPLFKFPFTKMGSDGGENSYNISTVLKRRKMLKILEEKFYNAGFERSSVWAFTKKGIPKYCSVTVPLYIGLGASGSTYLKDIFYLNTFSAAEYVKAFENRSTAIALSLDLSEKMQMAGWLYWRVYETKFQKKDFKKRFGKDFDSVYGKYFKPLAELGLLQENGKQIILTDKGSYWLHAFEDFFSIDYISKLWGSSKQEPWIKKVVL